jgi:hypothetical protein
MKNYRIKEASFIHLTKINTAKAEQNLAKIVGVIPPCEITHIFNS